MEELIALPIIFLSISLLFVIPLWLILHYTSKRRANTGVSDTARQELSRLMEIAEKMEQRIEALETILDSESPGWRRRHEL